MRAVWACLPAVLLALLGPGAGAVDFKGKTINMISGATYTSNGYITSLQSALDKAGLA